MRDELEKIHYYKTNLEVKITEAEADYKESLIKEKQSKHIQRLLTEQIEKLKEEKGQNRVGLNKDTLISRMKAQVIKLDTKKNESQKVIKESKLWAVKIIETMKEERN